jgi:uncharacterized protein YegP (UPF0339 family)
MSKKTKPAAAAKPKKYTIVMWRALGEWRWTMRARNGRIVGASTEGYKRRAAAIANMHTVTNFLFRIHGPWVRSRWTKEITR